MSKRGKNIVKIENWLTKTDSFYTSWWLEKMVTKLMKNGKKGFVEKKVLDVLIRVKEQKQINPIKLIYKAIKYMMPIMKILKKRKGKFYIDIPSPLLKTSQNKQAIKNIIAGIRARIRKNKGLEISIMEELLLKRYTEKMQLLTNKEENIYILKEKKDEKVIKETIWEETKTKLLRQLVEARVNSRKRW